MVDAVLKLEDGTKFQVLAPVVRQRKGTQQKLSLIHISKHLPGIGVYRHYGGSPQSAFYRQAEGQPHKIGRASCRERV